MPILAFLIRKNAELEQSAFEIKRLQVNVKDKEIGQHFGYNFTLMSESANLLAQIPISKLIWIHNHFADMTEIEILSAINEIDSNLDGLEILEDVNRLHERYRSIIQSFPYDSFLEKLEKMEVEEQSKVLQLRCGIVFWFTKQQEIVTILNIIDLTEYHRRVLQTIEGMLRFKRFEEKGEF